MFKSDDTDIEVVSGEKFGIRLPDVAGTADAWRVASDPDRSFLEDEGTSFQQVLDATREGLARYYLGATGMAGAEISFLLGFEDPNSFIRAFHDWTGTTPERLRSQLRADAR